MTCETCVKKMRALDSIREMRAALLDFASAYRRVRSAWHALGNNAPEAEERMLRRVPITDKSAPWFVASFDELGMDEWCEACIGALPKDC